MSEVPSPSSWAINQSLDWAKDNTFGSWGGCGLRGGKAIALFSCSIAVANSAKILCSNTLRTANSTPKLLRIRVTNWVANRECPPNSKKLSRRPTDLIFKRSCHRLANNSSVGVTGISPSVNIFKSGIGRAFLSNFPLGVRGRVSKIII